MRLLLKLSVILLIGLFQFRGFASPIESYKKRDAIRYILNDYCKNDCTGYLHSHSSQYRQVFIQALNGDTIALRRVFLDPHFHSGDNEAWEPIPGNILFVVGDRCFADFVSDLGQEDQRWALMKIPIAAPFHDADTNGKAHYFKVHFPRTHRLYALDFPEDADD